MMWEIRRWLGVPLNEEELLVAHMCSDITANISEWYYVDHTDNGSMYSEIRNDDYNIPALYIYHMPGFKPSRIGNTNIRECHRKLIVRVYLKAKGSGFSSGKFDNSIKIFAERRNARLSMEDKALIGNSNDAGRGISVSSVPGHRFEPY